MKNALYFTFYILTVIICQSQNLGENNKELFIKIENVSDYCKIVINEKGDALLLIDIEMSEGINFDTDTGIVMTLVNDGKLILESTLSSSDINGKLVTSFYVSEELVGNMKLSSNFFRNGSKFRMEMNVSKDDHGAPKPVTSVTKNKIIE